MTVSLLPFRFHPLDGRTTLLVSEAGDFLLDSGSLLDRMVHGRLAQADAEVLLERGFAYRSQGDFHWNSHSRRLKDRKLLRRRLNYVVAIPTLRCDLSCGYCQVARAKPDAAGVDWTDETERDFLSFLETHASHATDPVQGPPLLIEFQGGEPTLRLDVIERVTAFAEQRFPGARIVICTNLSTIPRGLPALLEKDGVSISTSLDGPAGIHTVNRTGNAEATDRFLKNLQGLLAAFGREKVSALPTIRTEDYGRISEIIDIYLALGLDTVYLRPLSPHGFARRPRVLDDDGAEWREAYRAALRSIFAMNLSGRGPVTEYGLQVALRRIFWPGYTGHVDLRSPNPAGVDSVVVDHDGGLYPSDEARMLARTGHADLKLGTVRTGFDGQRLRALNWNQIGETDPDCIHCAYQPFCGVDTVDDLARRGRIDAPRHGARFCKDAMALFAMIFDMIGRGDPGDMANLSGHLTGRFDPVPFHGLPYHG